MNVREISVQDILAILHGAGVSGALLLGILAILNGWVVTRQQHVELLDELRACQQRPISEEVTPWLRTTVASLTSPTIPGG